jgi:acyl-CoA reductase-like NAD-dependent aldehyde dehydrogenase
VVIEPKPAISKVLRLAKALNVGPVCVNCSDVFDPHLPFGGTKESDWERELGQNGIEGFLARLRQIMFVRPG